MFRWDINPFTGEFEEVGGSGNGTSIDFLISDWILSAGLYQLDLQHNLESEDVTVEVFEGDSEVDLHRIQILNTNTVRIFSTFDPDCRFSGKAVILAP